MPRSHAKPVPRAKRPGHAGRTGSRAHSGGRGRLPSEQVAGAFARPSRSTLPPHRPPSTASSCPRPQLPATCSKEFARRNPDQVDEDRGTMTADMNSETTMSTEDELKAELERLKAENASLKARGSKGVSMKVSEKGGVSVYGLGRFPVTFYQEQWLKLLDLADDIRAFIKEHESQLKKKE